MEVFGVSYEMFYHLQLDKCLRMKTILWNEMVTINVHSIHLMLWIWMHSASYLVLLRIVPVI